MTFTAFFIGISVLLIAPGPTNMLMALAGAQGGWCRILPLMAVAVAGYLTTSLALVWAGAHILAQWPEAGALLKMLAAGWVLFLAIRMWQPPRQPGAGGTVTAAQVYLTTLLNPKALVFGLVLLPSSDAAAFLLKTGVFMIMIMIVAFIWGSAGSLTRTGQNGRRRLHMLQRIASMWLAMISVTLVAGIVRA